MFLELITKFWVILIIRLAYTGQRWQLLMAYGKYFWENAVGISSADLQGSFFTCCSKSIALVPCPHFIEQNTGTLQHSVRQKGRKLNKIITDLTFNLVCLLCVLCTKKIKLIHNWEFSRVWQSASTINGFQLDFTARVHSTRQRISSQQTLPNFPTNINNFRELYYWWLITISCQNANTGAMGKMWSRQSHEPTVLGERVLSLTSFRAGALKTQLQSFEKKWNFKCPQTEIAGLDSNKTSLGMMDKLLYWNVHRFHSLRTPHTKSKLGKSESYTT